MSYGLPVLSTAFSLGSGVREAAGLPHFRHQSAPSLTYASVSPQNSQIAGYVVVMRAPLGPVFTLIFTPSSPGQYLHLQVFEALA
jgi:hypothetical protein